MIQCEKQLARIQHTASLLRSDRLQAERRGPQRKTDSQSSARARLVFFFLPARKMSSSSHIVSLPSEVLDLIFEYLPFRSLFVVSACCKRLYKTCWMYRRGFCCEPFCLKFLERNLVGFDTAQIIDSISLRMDHWLRTEQPQLLGPEELTPLNSFTSLTNLDLQSPLADNSLSVLASTISLLSGLRSLRVQRLPLLEADEFGFSSTSLTSLSFRRLQPNAPLPLLASRLPNLVRFEFHLDDEKSDVFQLSGLCVLGQLRFLRELSLQSVAGLITSEFTALTQLDSLCLHRASLGSYTSLIPLWRLTSLTLSASLHSSSEDDDHVPQKPVPSHAFSALRHLALSTSSPFGAFMNPRSLEYFSVDLSWRTCRLVSRLSAFTCLSALHLQGLDQCYPDFPDMKVLGHLRLLTELSLSGLDSGGPDFYRRVAWRVTGLRSLALHSSPNSSLSLSVISAFQCFASTLETLFLTTDFTYVVKTADTLRAFTRLRNLELGMPISPELVTGFTALSNLRSLRISGTVDLKAIPILSLLTQLTKCTVYLYRLRPNIAVSFRTLRQLLRIPGLQRLYLPYDSSIDLRGSKLRRMRQAAHQSSRKPTAEEEELLSAMKEKKKTKEKRKREDGNQ